MTRFLKNILNNGLLCGLHLGWNVIPHAVSPEIDKRQVPNGIDAQEEADQRGGHRYRIAGALRNCRLIATPVPEQVQHKNHEKYIFVKRLPGRQLDGISKTSAIGHFVKVSRVECQEGEKHQQQQHHPHGDAHAVEQQHSHAQHNLQDNQHEPDRQRSRYEVMKQVPKVLSKYLKVLLHLDLRTYRIVQLDQP